MNWKYNRFVPVPHLAKNFEWVHTNLYGPINESSQGTCYCIVIMDDCIQWTNVYFVITKSEVNLAWIAFKAWILTNFPGSKTGFLYSDNGGENLALLQNLLNDAIIWECSPPYAQDKNDVAESMSKNLNSKARCLLYDAQVPKFLWIHVVQTSCYIYQQAPQASLNHECLYQALWRSKHNIYHFKRFGCQVFIYIPPAMESLDW